MQPAQAVAAEPEQPRQLVQQEPAQQPERPAYELFGAAGQQQPSSGRPPPPPPDPQHSGSEDSLLPGIGVRRAAKRARPPGGGSNLRPAAPPRASPRLAPRQPEPEVVDLTQDDD